MQTVTRLLMLGFGCLALLPASADVTIKSNFRVKTATPFGAMENSGEVTSMISGNKSRTNTVTESNSAFMNTIGSGGTNYVFTLLDRGVVWTVDPDKGQYTEMFLDQMRSATEEWEKMQAAQANEAQAENPLPVDDDACTLDEENNQMNKTGDKITVAGLKAEHWKIKFSQTCRDPETGKTCRMTWLIDQWMVKKFPGIKEVNRYWDAYAERMGLDEYVDPKSRGVMPSVVTMFDQGWNGALGEAGGVQGFPAKSRVEMLIGGEDCTMDDGQQIASSETFADAAVDVQNAVVDQVAAETTTAIGQETAEAVGGGVGGRIAGSAIGAIGKNVGGLFGGMKKKKKKEQEAQQIKVKTGAVEGDVRLILIEHEIESHSTETIASGVFELDPAWKKRETSGFPMIGSQQ
ncbi:MAG: hypothetical protein QNJ73_12160 [Gammaproteobacteria bacterium]|nr:hypothetical protein [Gammaproteobacteria bacterium]